MFHVRGRFPQPGVAGTSGFPRIKGMTENTGDNGACRSEARVVGCGASGYSGRRKEQIDLVQDFGNCLARQCLYHRRVAPAPVEALHLIREDDAGDTQALRNRDLETDIPLPGGDRDRAARDPPGRC